MTAPSSGPRLPASDYGFAQGIVMAWDAIAGTNKIRVRGSTITDMLSLVGSETGLVRVGDSVVVGKVQNTYAVFGRIEPPGIEQRALGIQFATTINLNAPGSTNFERRNGPEVSVHIGSSRRCMVTLSAEINIVGSNVERLGVQVIGASTISAVEWKCLTISSAGGEFQASRVLIFESADGLNEGDNIFQTMHKTGNNVSNIPLVGDVQITVQPF